MVDNPAYQGVWTPREIPNPDYYEDLHPADLSPIGAVGFELWSMQSEILFDNIYLGHSVKDAKKLAIKTWGVKLAVEKLYQKADVGADLDLNLNRDLNLNLDPEAPPATELVAFVQHHLNKFVQLAKIDVVNAVKEMPLVAGAVALVTLLLTFVLGNVLSLFLPKSTPAPEVKDVKEAKETKDVKETKETKGTKDVKETKGAKKSLKD